MTYKPIKKKNNAIVLLAGLGLAIGAMYSLRRCNSSDMPWRPVASGGDTIDVAIEYSPMSFYRYNDTLGGFNYDLLRTIAQRHGMTLKFHPIVSLSQSLEYIDNNTYDLLAADLPATADFKERYTLLEPVLLDKQVLVQRRDSTSGVPHVKSQLDLAGDTVWIVEGSSVESRITNLGREIGDTIYMRFEPEYGAEQLFLMVATGEINNAVISERVARDLVKDYPDVDISTNISFTQFQSWIISEKRPSLGDSLNLWISDFKKTKEYDALMKRYVK